MQVWRREDLCAFEGVRSLGNSPESVGLYTQVTIQMFFGHV